MPTNRKRIGRRIHNVKEYELAFLRDDPQTLPGWAGFSLSCARQNERGLDGERKPVDLWREHKNEFLPEFIRKHPGRRPVAWWLYDAPRWDRKFDAWFDGTLMEPRRQVGGAGATPWDSGLAVVPWFSYGLPNSWEGYDAADPPRFESQAAYLQRHGLLTEAERKVLLKMPELFEPETVTWFENDDDEKEEEEND
jgi:hypothetical protein